MIFGIGLVISGMWNSSNIKNFLTLNKKWDPSLLYVMGTIIIINTIIFQYMIKIQKKPVLLPEFW